METLSHQVEARAERLARSSVEGLYTDPFWAARYGEERARRFGGEDAHFHVKYLVQALALDKPSVMEEYARWLRTLLVSRGMCTRHLDDHLAGLARALAAEGFGPGTPPERCVRAAREALRYPAGPANALQHATAALARRAADALGAEGAEQRAALEAELQLQLSYLADALGTERPELYAEHCRWYAGFWPRRGFQGLDYCRVLGALEAVLSDHEAARALVTGARVKQEESRS
jgi:hypothetical protein